MKANLKGLGGIKGLALRHGEKVVIAIAGLVAAWFVYSSLNLPRLKPEYQADKLKGKISQTTAAIDNSTWPEADTEEANDVREFKQFARTAAVTIDAKDYPFPGIDPPVVAQTQLRGDPLVLNAVDVRARGQSGVLGFHDANTLKEQERLRELKLAEEQQEQERLTKQQPQNVAEAPGGRGGRPGSREGQAATEVFDTEHPKRRLLEGMVAPTGVPLQGGERLARASWATVVAKVPIREQLKLFEDAFRDARGYDAARDFPQYVGYQVQRREVVGGKPTEWKVVNVFDGQKKYVGKNVNSETVTDLNKLASEQWAGPALEPVDPRWTDPVLTLPLPPLVGRNFGEDATHPDIPLAMNAPPPEEPAVPTETPVETPDAGDDGGAFSAGAGGQQLPTSGGFAQPRPFAPAFGGPESMERSPGFGGMSRMPMGIESEFGGRIGGMSREGGMMPGGGIATAQRTTLPREVDDLLLRFFDYTVEPGKEYQYRVMVYLADPNSNIPLNDGMLESAVIDRRFKEIQKAKEANKSPQGIRGPETWSDPSPVVGIPAGGTVYVAEAKAASNKTANDEPAIKVFADTVDIESDGSAIHVAQETELHRGAVINLKGEMKYTGENGRWIDSRDDYALNTGLTVLDVAGGEELAKKMTAPSRVLLMDGAGQLLVREEMDDSSNVRNLRSVFSDKRRKPTPGPGGEFGPEGGPRGGRGP